MDISINRSIGLDNRTSIVGVDNISLKNTHVFVGKFAGSLNANNKSTAVVLGYEAARSSNNTRNNVFIGYRAGYNTQSENNVFIGSNTGTNIQSGGRNVFMGTDVSDRKSVV